MTLSTTKKTSPDTSVASDLAAMMASTATPSPSGSSVAQPSVAASGESPKSFLSTLNAAADGGVRPINDSASDSGSHEDVFDSVLTSDDLVFVGSGVDNLCGGNV